MDDVEVAHLILKQAIEGDEGTLTADDQFESLLASPDYPEKEVHRWLNLNQEIISRVIQRSPDGKTAQVLQRAIHYVTDPEGSHGYSIETAKKIYGVER